MLLLAPDIDSTPPPWPPLRPGEPRKDKRISPADDPCLKNPISYTCLYGRTKKSSCVHTVDPNRINEILRARPGVCSRYGPNQIICQADGRRSDCPSPLEGRVKEDRVVWQNWCEEYKRLVREVVWQPLEWEFRGPQAQWYQAVLNFGFYNPRSNSARAVTNQAKRTGATVWERPGMIFVSAKPGHQVWDRRRNKRFLQSVNERISNLAKKIPPFPPGSNLSYFTRPSKIELNVGQRKTQYFDCKNFLDEIEGRRPMR